MLGVAAYPLPEGAALQEYAQRPGYYTDCFATILPGAVSLPDFVEAFYTTPLFKAERLILRLFLGMRSTDAGVHDVAHGVTDRFAAWQAAGRRDNQLLMKAAGRTASWFMVEPAHDGTRLLFGSFVAPEDETAERPNLGPLFSAALGGHRLYSILLLASARRRLQRVKRVSDRVAT